MTVGRNTFGRLTPGQRAVIVGLVLLVVAAAVIVGILSGGEPVTDTSVAGPLPTTTSQPGALTTTAPTATTVPGTTTTVPPSTTTTSGTASIEDRLLLKPDGLGDFLFGSDADATVTGLSQLLGPPDDDTGWLDQATAFGTCIGETVRFVRWKSLQIFTTDGETDWAPAGKRHFAAYVNSNAYEGEQLALITAERAGIGTTVGDLRSLYTENLTIEDEPFLGDFFRVDFPGSGFLLGAVTGLGPSDIVESVAAGVSCGE